MVYRVIGLMSGTSLDGLDIACCTFEQFGGRWNYKLVDSKTVSFPDHLAHALHKAMQLSGHDLAMLDRELGRWFGREVRRAIDTTGFSPDFIGSHGHTIFHEPDKGLTFQIGYAPEIVAATGIPVINDFRGMDVALGGQGAPLVPVGDHLLFPDMDYCLNLGGIANISFTKSERRVAFDICPANMVLNRLAGEAGKNYDDRGNMAASGKMDENLLNTLNGLSFYTTPYPKSLGYEWVSNQVFPHINNQAIPLQDRLYTFCHHVAEQISAVIIDEKETDSMMLCTGGGTFNDFLMECIERKVNVKVVKPDKSLVSHKEAIIFAFLAVLRWRGETNCLPDVTGARQASSGGAVSSLLSS